jgi:hypothetical protein
MQVGRYGLSDLEFNKCKSNGIWAISEMFFTLSLSKCMLKTITPLFKRSYHIDVQNALGLKQERELRPSRCTYKDAY